MSEPPKVEEPVPKLPRGRGMKFSGPELFRIGLTLVTLIGVLVLTQPCASAVSGFVTSFDNGSAQSMPKPGTVMPQQYEQLTPGMTEAEIKAAVERSKARAGGVPTAGSAGSANVGSANAGSASSANSNSTGSAAGSATPGSAQ